MGFTPPALASSRCDLVTNKGDRVSYYFDRNDGPVWSEASFTKNDVHYL